MTIRSRSVRRRGAPAATNPVPLPGQETGLGDFSWLLMSDVCKHCKRAGCMEACPTGAIVRTEFDTVYVQPDICNGCGYCITGCPFGVIDRREEDGRAWKCTLCYDRLSGGMTPACAKACPTDSIQFGDLDELRAKAEARVAALHERGLHDAYLYGADPTEQPGTEGLNAFFLLVDKPEVYNLPPDPVAPAKRVRASWLSMTGAMVAMIVASTGAVLGAKRG
jgi:formate dehydrogenase iron-sulfur subunit